MCHFVSWKELGGKLYYLTCSDLSTKKGRELRRYLGTKFVDDIAGHGAIDWYFELNGKGTNKEVTDFSSPDIPKEIAGKIKKGCFEEIGFNESLLNMAGKKAYEKITNTAFAEYVKIKNTAFAEYVKIANPAFWNIFKHIKYRNKAWK